MPCLSVGHHRAAMPGTRSAMAERAGEGAVAMNSTTCGHGPLPTADAHTLNVIPAHAGRGEIR
jgi:hypothetical protein